MAEEQELGSPNKLETLFPENEEERLVGVNALELVDTPAEERFDRYTRLACRLFQAPVAMLTLMERERQWFKSAQGHLINETPRAHSFCQHTIVKGATLVVEDASLDSRYFDLPAVFDLGIKFYAGVPIRDTHNRIVGTLCVLDFQSRKQTDSDTHALEDLAKCAQSELRLDGLIQTERKLLSEMDRLRRRASIQAVTRCWNEATGLDILQKLMSQLRPDARTGLGILLVSISGLESLKAQFGEDVANLVLRESANRLRRALGGEGILACSHLAHFMILIPQMEAILAESTSEELLRKASTTPFRLGAQQFNLEFWGGLTLYSGAAEAQSRLLQRASSALSSARKNAPGKVRTGL